MLSPSLMVFFCRELFPKNIFPPECLHRGDGSDCYEMVEGMVVIISGVYLLNYARYFPNSKWRERCQQKKDCWVPVRGNQQILYICLFLGWLCSGCLNLWEQVKCPFTSLIAPHCHHHHQQQPPLTETLHKTYKYSTKMSTKQHTLSSWCIICMN